MILGSERSSPRAAGENSGGRIRAAELDPSEAAPTGSTPDQDIDGDADSEFGKAKVAGEDVSESRSDPDRLPRATIAAGTRLVIIRHGEAVANAEDVIGGHLGCQGLTDRGRDQARLLARRLERTGELSDAAALYASLLPRSIETAEVLSPALGGLVIESRCDVCERHPGEADGLTWREYERRYGRVSLPGADPHLPLSPGGESWIDFVRRVEVALVDIALAHPGRLVVVVAHGGVIDSSVIRFLNLPDEGTRIRLHPDHTSITEWQFGGAKWRFARYNDAAHLADPAASKARTPMPDWVERDTQPAPA